jgi:hypothetical protein
VHTQEAKLCHLRDNLGGEHRILVPLGNVGLNPTVNKVFDRLFGCPLVVRQLVVKAQQISRGELVRSHSVSFA